MKRHESHWAVAAGERRAGVVVRDGLARAGFTIPEMLAVVAIIVIILSILLPALGQAKEVERKAECMSQIGQHVRAARDYATEWRGYMPQLRQISGPRFSYVDLLQPYLHSYEIFHCPSASPNPAQIKSYSKTRGRIDYGMNHYGRGAKATSPRSEYHDTMGWCIVDSNHGKIGNRRTIDVANHDVVYFSDSETETSPEDIGGISRGKNEWPVQVSFNIAAWKRHLVGYNTGQLDGSAKWWAGNIPNYEHWWVKRTVRVTSQDDWAQHCGGR